MDLSESLLRKKSEQKESENDQGSDVSEDDEEEEEEEECLEIPVRDERGEESEDVIQIPLSDLPGAMDMLGVLKSERAALHRWLSCAVAYYRQGRLEDCNQVLEEGCSKDIEEYYREDEEGRLNLLNALAAFKISQVSQSKSSAESTTFLSDAVELFNRADRIDNRKAITWVNKGVLSLYRNEDDNALHHFQNALEADPKNLLAQLGHGAMMFRRRKFKEARDIYRMAIRNHPGCGAYVRVNLGLCFYELGDEQRAVMCFQRALQLDEDEANALVALAVIELGQAQQKNFDLKLSQRAMQRLRRAYELQPSNPMVLNHLANHFFFRKEGDNEKITTLAQRAYKSTRLDSIKAESCYILGRNFHEQGDTENASAFYERALKHWPQFTLAQLGKIQLMFKESEEKSMDKSDKKRKAEAETIREKALNSLEKNILSNPDYKKDRDANMFAAWIYLRMNQRAKAMQYLKNVTHLNEFDTEAWLEQTRCFQKESHMTKKKKREALKAYRKAAEAFESQRTPIPAYIYNNVGELNFSIGEVRSALENFKVGLEQQKDDTEKEIFITLRYNLARVLETLGDFDEAEKIYQELRSELPQYSDPIIRLGQIAETNGQYNVAMEFYLEATKTSTNPGDAWVCLGRMEQKRGNGNKAREYFSKLTKSKDEKSKSRSKDDVYARLSKVSILLDTFASKKSLNEKSTNHLEEAKDKYKKILERNHANIYAANGLGATMAILGDKNEAREIFDRLREPDDAANPSVWINLAHIYTEDGRYDAAALLYQQCMKQFDMENDTELLQYLGNALLRAKKFEEAKTVMLRAIYIDPSDLTLRFNLAVLLLQYGNSVCSNVNETRTLYAVMKAVTGFSNAYALMQWLLTTKGSPVYLQPPGSPMHGEPGEENTRVGKKWKEFQASKSKSTNSSSSNASTTNGTVALPQRRSDAERAPKDESFIPNLAVVSKRLREIQQATADSRRHIALEQSREENKRQQLLSLQEQSEKIDQELEERRRQEEEQEQLRRQEKEARAKEQQEKTEMLAQQFKEQEVQKEKRKSSRQAGAGKKRSGGKRGKKSGDDFIAPEAAEKDSDSSSSSSDDGGGNKSKSRKMAKKKASSKKRSLKKKQKSNDDDSSDSSSSSSSSSSDSSSDEDEPKKRKNDNATGGEERQSKKTKLDSDDDDDDNGADNKGDTGKTDTTAENNNSDDKSGEEKKKPDSDDEEAEMEF